MTAETTAGAEYRPFCVAITRAQHGLVGDGLRRTGEAGNSVSKLPHRPRPGASPRGRRRPASPVQAQPNLAPSVLPHTDSPVERGRTAEQVAQDAKWAAFRRWFATRDVWPPRRPPEMPQY